MRIPFSVIVLIPILAEIAGFIVVGKAIGVLATLGLVLLGMVVGVALIRWQGVSTLRKVRAELAADGAPGRPLAEGAVTAVAALLLIVPGFISDLVAIAIFIPPIRRAFWRAIRNRSAANFTVRTSGASRRPASIDLDPDDYGTIRRSAGHSRSPWTQPQGENPP